MFVGGGYAGVEAFAELQDTARFALKYHPGLRLEDMHWMLVEASDRILAEVSLPMSEYTVDRLREREMDVRLSTRLDSCVDGRVKLSDGTDVASDTIVWTAGVKASPVLEKTGFELDRLHRLPCTADMRVRGMTDAWSAGDCAAVPDLTKGDGSPDSPTCAPNAQHAVRQAKLLGVNIARSLHGHQPKDYRHKYVGSVASLGLYHGVAEVYGIKLKGFPAWTMHRVYHLSRMPTANRKTRIALEWLLAFLFGRDVTPISQLAMPNREFRRAADPVEQAARGGNRAGDASRNLDDLGRDSRVDASAANSSVTTGTAHGDHSGRDGSNRSSQSRPGAGSSHQPVGSGTHEPGQVDRTAPQTTPKPPEDSAGGQGSAGGQDNDQRQGSHTREGSVMTEHAEPGRPTPTEERTHREEGLPAKTTHDGDREVSAVDAPDTPGFGTEPERVSAADEAVSRG